MRSKRGGDFIHPQTLYTGSYRPKWSRKNILHNFSVEPSGSPSFVRGNFGLFGNIYKTHSTYMQKVCSFLQKTVLWILMIYMIYVWKRFQMCFNHFWSKKVFFDPSPRRKQAENGKIIINGHFWYKINNKWKKWNHVWLLWVNRKQELIKNSVPPKIRMFEALNGILYLIWS